MDPLTQQWVDATKAAVKSIQQVYRVNRAMLLTEGDLQCHLFSELLKQESISGFHRAKDDTFWNDSTLPRGLKTTYVHSEVTWFKPGKRSGFEVDLTICDPMKLEVVNLELFEECPNKGFAYDGECVAIELKFIRDLSHLEKRAVRDYQKMRDELIPAKLANIHNEMYRVSSPYNIAFISVVGCKNREIFDLAKVALGKQLSDPLRTCPDNLFVGIFYQDCTIWDKEELRRSYQNWQQIYQRPNIHY